MQLFCVATSDEIQFRIWWIILTACTIYICKRHPKVNRFWYLFKTWLSRNGVILFIWYYFTFWNKWNKNTHFCLTYIMSVFLIRDFILLKDAVINIAMPSFTVWNLMWVKFFVKCDDWWGLGTMVMLYGLQLQTLSLWMVNKWLHSG